MKELLMIATLLFAACGDYGRKYTDCEMVEDRIMCDEDYMDEEDDS